MSASTLRAGRRWSCVGCRRCAETGSEREVTRWLLRNNSVERTREASLCWGKSSENRGKKKKKARGGQLSAASTQGKVRGPIALRGIPASEHLQDETERSEEKAELPAHDFVISLTVLDADFKAPAVGVVG